MTESDSFRRHYGPVALVTGASSGIGRSFADVLAAHGMHVVLVARRAQRLREIAADLARCHGVQAQVCEADLSQAGAAEYIQDATAALDIGLIVSNAGFGMKGPHASNEPQAMTDMLMVNCLAPMQLARSFIPRLQQRGAGGLIFTSSVEALIGCPFSTAYSATKAFVNNLGEGLWGELTPLGIDVLTLCPGATDTEAPRLQGIDPATLHDVMSPDEVARLALAHLKKGPVYVPSDHYRALFDKLLSMPRRDALTAMAASMRPPIRASR